MKMKTLLVMYIIVHGLVAVQIGHAREADIRRECTHNRVYGTSVHQHKTAYYNCVTEARKRAQEYREKAKLNAALDAIIQANQTYQRNSRDMRNLLREIYYEKHHTQN